MTTFNMSQPIKISRTPSPQKLTKNWDKLKRLAKMESQQSQQANERKWSNKSLNKITESLEVIRKQMILQEVCSDVVRVKEILQKMIESSSVVDDSPTR